MEKVSNTNKVLILLGLLILGGIIGYFWDNIKQLWSKDAKAPGSRLTYNTERCCDPSNPCGWSRSLYDSQCGTRAN